MKIPNLNGWEKLICPYFAPTCQRVLGPYLEDNGFTEIGLDEIGGVRFSRFGTFLEISYALEAVPQYLTMALGIGDEKYEKGGHPCFVPYWHLLPRDSPEHVPGATRFKTPADLEALFLRFKDTFLEPYAKPLWLNLDRLEKTIENFRAEFSC